MEAYITVAFRMWGTHYYPGADKDPALTDFAHLVHPHQHPFLVTLKLQVLHEQREVEFFLLRRWAREQFPEREPVRFGPKSCETIAHGLLEKVLERYPGRRAMVRVDEDDDVGAEVWS